jgi:TetR/AcrR family transcriptional repressor of nem operon
MVRPLEFDRAAARDQALALFWDKGYQAGTLAELLDVMGIGRSSFYAAFGDKRNLFIECMDEFARRVQVLLQRARGEHPPLQALRLFLEGSATRAQRSRAHLGCLLVNTVLEMSGVDDGLVSHANAHLLELEATFAACLRDAGCAAPRAAELAAMLALVNEGVRVSNRRRMSAAQQLAPIRTTFELIARELS